jgi:DNA-directed RNA polymerase subunit N (RpoN/RPB10)
MVERLGWGDDLGFGLYCCLLMMFTVEGQIDLHM